MAGEKLKTPLSSGAVPAARRDGRGDVEREVVQAGQDAGLLQVVDAVRQHAGGDDDEEQAGPGEEHAQVEPQRAAVDQPAEQHRGRRGRGPRRSAGRAFGLAFTAVPLVACAPAHRNSAVSRPSRPTASIATTTTAFLPAPSASSSLWCRSDFMCRAVRAIQKIIQVTRPTATIDSVPPMASCASNDSPDGPNVSSAPKPSDDGDRDADAGPQRGQLVAAPGLDQVRDEDADDQRGLEAFAQTDEVVGDHGALPSGLQATSDEARLTSLWRTLLPRTSLGRDTVRQPACDAGHRPPRATSRSRSVGHASANAGSSGRSADLVDRHPAQLDALGVGDGGVHGADLVGEHGRVRPVGVLQHARLAQPRRSTRSIPASSSASRSAASSADSPGIRAPPGTPHVPPWSLHSARCCRTTAIGVPSASRRTSSSPAAPCRPQCRRPHAHSTQPSPGWRWRWAGGASRHARVSRRSRRWPCRRSRSTRRPRTAR